MPLVRKLSQRGDTIVEVLIAIAVASAILGGSYTIANKSSQQIRNAQERTEASKIAAGAVEKLASTIVSTDPLSVVSAGKLFCPDSGRAAAFTGLPHSAGNSVVTKANLDALGNSVSWETASDCYKQARYHIFIEKNLTIPNTYSIYVRWDGTDGQRKDLQYDYRMPR